MQSARARDQLPPTMDHKGTVEISSEYHAAGGMGIGQPAVTLPTRGTFLFKAEEVDLEFFWIVLTSQARLPTSARLPVFTSQATTNKRSTTQDFIYQPLQILVTARPNLLGLAGSSDSFG